MNRLEGGDRPQFVANAPDNLARDIVVRRAGARFQNDQSDRHHALEIVIRPDDCTFGNRRMGRDDLFDRPGRQAMARDIDDVIDAAHDVDKAIGVDQLRVSGGVITGMLAKIGVLEMAVASPQRRSEEQAAELTSLLRITYAVVCWTK